MFTSSMFYKSLINMIIISYLSIISLKFYNFRSTAVPYKRRKYQASYNWKIYMLTFISVCYQLPSNKCGIGQMNLKQNELAVPLWYHKLAFLHMVNAKVGCLEQKKILEVIYLYIYYGERYLLYISI